jgi:protein-arginine kinase activator protein McsA
MFKTQKREKRKMTNTTVYSNKDMQMDFWDNMGEVFGYDIIGSENHPLKKAFELYCDMMKEQEEDENEEEEWFECPKCSSESTDELCKIHNICGSCWYNAVGKLIRYRQGKKLE